MTWVSCCDSREYFSLEVRFCLAVMNGTFVLESRLDCPLFAISLMSVTKLSFELLVHMYEGGLKSFATT